QISNQQRYPEADRLFAEARAFVQRAPDRLTAAQLDYYLALNALNPRNVAKAKELAERAELEYAAILPPHLLAAAKRGTRVSAAGLARQDGADSGPLQF